MTPAKINAEEPTAVKRDPSDQIITLDGQSGTNTQETEEEYRKRDTSKIEKDRFTITSYHFSIEMKIAFTFYKFVILLSIVFFICNQEHILIRRQL